MEIRVGELVVHYVEHGSRSARAGAPRRRRRPPRGRGVLRAGVRRRCGAAADLSRPAWNGPDAAPETLRSADDVLDTLLELRRRGHRRDCRTSSSVTRRARTTRRRWPRGARRRSPVSRSSARCCRELRDVPEHRVVAGSGEIGDDVFRSYFVIQTPAMLERYERYVAPAAALVDQAALERIGERWELTPDHAPAYAGSDAWSWRGGWTRRSDTPPPPTSSTTTRTPRSPCSTTRDTRCRTSSRSSCAPSSPSGSRASSARRDACLPLFALA